VAILDRLSRSGPDQSVSLPDIARDLAGQRHKPDDPPDAWRRYLTAVRQQALHLARKGEITILRKGQPIDPHAPFRGLVRLALPKATAKSKT